MPAWIERLLELLAVRLWNVLAGKVAARLELELAATQAQLLEHAAAWRKDNDTIGEAVARRLEATSERLAAEAALAGDQLLLADDSRGEPALLAECSPGRFAGSGGRMAAPGRPAGAPPAGRRACGRSR